MPSICVFIIIFHLSLVFNNKPNRCFFTCPAHKIHNAIIYYANIPGDETLKEKHRKNPVESYDMFESKCNLDELNKIIECVAQDETLDVSQENMEYCFLKGFHENKDNCQINLGLGNKGLANAFFCLIGLSEISKPHYAFYYIVKNSKLFDQNITNYNNNLKVIKQIWCDIVKDFYKDNPTTDKSKLHKNIYKYAKTQNIFSRIERHSYIQTQFKCVMNIFSRSQKKNNNILTEICPDVMLSDFDSVNLVSKLFPIIEEKIKVVEIENTLTKSLVIDQNIEKIEYTSTKSLVADANIGEIENNSTKSSKIDLTTEKTKKSSTKNIIIGIIIVVFFILAVGILFILFKRKRRNVE